MKRILALLYLCTALFATLRSAPTSGGLALIVEMESGNRYFYLSEKPVVTFDGEHVFISTSDFSCTFDEVVTKIYFDENEEQDDPIETRIDKATLPENALSFRFVDGHNVEIDGLKPNAQVDVYTLDGKKMALDADRSANGFSIHLATYPQGVYIIKTGKDSFKVYKK